jgi:hypothetical protein
VGLLHHSDQGCTYASEDYQELLAASGIACSMSRRGNPHDNAVMESWNSTFKMECGERFIHNDLARSETFDYIEVFYNPEAATLGPRLRQPGRVREEVPGAAGSVVNLSTGSGQAQASSQDGSNAVSERFVTDGREAEVGRLLHGPKGAERPERQGLVHFRARCKEPSAVLRNAREVLLAVCRNSGSWPSCEDWKLVLPRWFVEACAPEQSQSEAEAWLAWWRTLPSDERDRVRRQKPWSLLNWLHWMQPRERSWLWWDGRIEGDSDLKVSVVVDGWPFPWGALEWLLRASGASVVDADE